MVMILIYYSFFLKFKFDFARETTCLLVSDTLVILVSNKMHDKITSKPVHGE